MADRFDEMAESWLAGVLYDLPVTKARAAYDRCAAALRRVAAEENEACAAIADPQSEKISYETCNAFTCLSAAAGMIRKRRKEIGK